MNNNHDVSCKKIKEAVCIDTARVYDSCADKDCLADVRVYFTEEVQNIIDCATTVRCRGAEVINVITEVERVPFNRGFYSIDLTFFFAVKLDVISGHKCPTETVEGLAVFSKKCILYGSDGNVKIFTSEFKENEIDEQFPVASSNPRAKVQVAEPICLDVKLCRPCDCCNNIADVSCCVPKCVRRHFGGNFIDMNSEKAVRVTIGLFTIVQLERDIQILIPAYDFCIPEKECSCDNSSVDPCDSFRKIKFPVNEFFPVKENTGECDYNDITAFTESCGCSCKNK